MDKARLEKWDGGNWSTVVKCKFNPTQLTVSKSNTYNTAGDAPNQGVQIPTFGGGDAASMTLDLFFDTTDTGADVRREYTDKLVDLMTPAGQAGTQNMPTGTPTTSVDASRRAQRTQASPPSVRFVWGKIVSFEAYLISLNLTYNLFLADGTPVRATAQATLKQARDEDLWPKQNPTSQSMARKLWVVSEGETLDWIAYKEYGNVAHWRHIAETNQLANPRALRPGQLLKLEPLPSVASAN